MHPKGLASLVSVCVLCLPSLAGGFALCSNFLARRPIGEWNLPSSLSVALAVMFGVPLVLLALVIGGFAMLNVQVPRRIKWADGIVLVLAVVCSLAVSFRFRV